MGKESSINQSAGERPLIVGLTGGIGSGKSTIANAFEALGVCIVDTDLIAHQLTAPSGAGIEPIRQAFGDAVIAADGSMDRIAMRERVFADADERKRLEAILHPLIRIETDRQISACDSPYLIMAVPLLVESGNWHNRVDQVLVIDCQPETQIGRVMTRNGMTRARVESILNAQASREQRLAAADEVIDNDGDLQSALTRISSLHSSYLALAKSRQTLVKQQRLGENAEPKHAAKGSDD